MSGPKARSLKERIQDKIKVLGNGCWEWQGAPNKNGYGTLVVGSRAAGRSMKLAHRVSYAEWVEEVPDGLDLDHQCHNRDTSCPGGKQCRHRLCVNPAHLEPATRKENLDRGRHPTRERDACSRGHRYTEGSFRLDSKANGSQQRRCLQCQREQARNRRR